MADKTMKLTWCGANERILKRKCRLKQIIQYFVIHVMRLEDAAGQRRTRKSRIRNIYADTVFGIHLHILNWSGVIYTIQIWERHKFIATKSPGYALQLPHKAPQLFGRLHTRKASECFMSRLMSSTSERFRADETALFGAKLAKTSKNQKD